MKLSEVLEDVFRNDIDLWISGERLHYRDPHNSVTSELEGKLQQYETTIVSYMRTPEGDSLPFYPLSSAQKTIWFLDQLASDSTTLRLKFEARFLSKVDIPALQKALQALVDRHASLRTSYHSLDGEPVQQIKTSQNVSFEVIDCTQNNREQIGRCMHAVTECPFDLEDGQVLQAFVFTLPGGRHILWLLIHHIAVDCRSFEMLLEELGTLYTEFCKKRSQEEALASLDPVKHTYTDYIRWKLKMLGGPKGEAHVTYLRDLLSGELPALNLPTDRPRPAAQTYNTASRFLTMNSTLTSKIKKTVQEQRTSLYPFLVAAYFVLLHRYTGQEDLLLGAPRSEQGHRQFQGIVGYFENPLPLRADLSGNPAFKQFLRQVHQMIWHAFDHEDYPSHLLANQLHLNRDASHSPLFQSIFILQEQYQRKDFSAFLFGQGGERIEMDGLIMQSVGLNEQLPIFVDLQLTMFEEHGTLTALWQYNTDLFDETTIERMGEHFHVLLEGIVAELETPIAELPLLTEEEKQKILVEWNDTEADYPKDTCIHELFEEQAERTPEALAVVAPGAEDSRELSSEPAQLTYRELNQQANQLAHYLRKHGVGPDVLVGICVERSLDTIVGILGILKAGGAYVPLDPAYPAERLRFMLEDSQVSILLTQEKLLPKLGGASPHMFCLDRDKSILLQECSENLESSISIENLAYMIYTSGSTGQPKGVLITCEALLNLVYWHQRAFEVNTSDRTTQLAGPAFDASVWEIWPYLTIGATLYLVKPELLASPEALRDYLITQNITITFAPTPLAEELLSIQWPADTPLRLMLTGGDVLHHSSFSSIPFTVINNYGPTESTVVTTSGKVSIAGSDNGRPPIGRPISNTKVYILDRHFQLLPPGVPGELCINSVSLARGYLNCPELTEKKFVPDPFSSESGSRIYKTGDLARYLPDGNLEFFDRIDHQVKIRGFRIELGEIEVILEQHARVKENVIIARKEKDGNKKLVAYIVPDNEPQKTNEDKPAKGTLSDHVSQWQNLYDDTYEQETPVLDPMFNVVGWNSSYTGQAIPENDMRKWVDSTVQRILGLQPERVLEIGCGTGLLLFRIVPYCEQYWGIDFSPIALAFVRQQIAEPESNLSQVQLFQKTADDFEGIPLESFNVAILNSVSQHFPNVEYFLTVLEGMIASTTPGGSIFIGDVRSLTLLELFHCSVQLYQAPEDLSMKELQQRVRHHIDRENELVISPEFFLALKGAFPRITHVQIQPKRGTFRNELSCFRYDVTLCIEHECCERPQIQWLDWRAKKMNMTILRQILLEDHPEFLGLRHVANARLQTDLHILKRLQHSDENATIAELRESLRELPQEEAIDPEEFWQIEELEPYDVYISWAASDREGIYDVLFVRRTLDGSKRTCPSFPNEHVQFKPLNAYVNNPTQAELERKLVPHLRTYLQEKLPEYMIPSAFVLLKNFPLTPNGKVDRRALPAPERSRPELDTQYVSPRSELEELLVEIWKELLDLEQIGVYDDFFELGGDSLSATRLISHVCTTFELELPVTTLFEVHNVVGLAELVESKLLEEIGAMDEEEAQRLLENG